MIFSKRYYDLIYDKNGKLLNDFCQELEYGIKEKIASIMIYFAEPQIFTPNRYDNYQVSTDALTSAVNAFNDILGWTMHHNDAYSQYSVPELAMIMTCNLFDIVELQYKELSTDEKIEFQKKINDTFVENETPWLLIDSRIIKIDSRQFEADLQAKMLLKMKELKDCEPKFQSAFKELLDAHECFDKQDYSKTISDAEKCYESVLKIVCGLKKGNAQVLTQEYINNHLGNIPSIMKPTGFKDNVLMSLPYIRNNSASDHGAGEENIVIAKEFARLALNLSATLCTYVINTYKQNLSDKN